MPHMKFEPLKELEYLTGRLRKFAEDFPETFSFEFGSGFEPKLDLVHDETTVTVIAELPGVRKADVSLSVSGGNVLEIKGTKQADIDPDAVTIVRSERSFGPFACRISLPVDDEHGSIEAHMADGLLRVVMKKRTVQTETEIKVDIL